jgi:hypothetical protein
MKYLIVKGWLGFGDRLESLKMAVSFAKCYNLQIYVDWRDPGWSHGSEDFYTYFKLVNMPVLNSLSDIPEDATYYPAFWKGNLDKHVTYDFIQEHAADNINFGLLDKSFDGDVIVFSSCGTRFLYNDSSFFANSLRVVDQRILSKVQHHASRKPLSQSWGIHIRGTDRAKGPNRRHVSIQSIVSYFTVMGGINMQNFVVMSDDVEQVSIWKRYYPDSYVVSEASLQTSNLGGLHNISKDQLRSSKDEINVDLLVDFFVLTSCERIFSTMKDSRFAAEARRLHPVVGQILNGN